MELFIVRHGIAEDVSADGSDEARGLTEEGRKKMKEEAVGFSRLGWKPQRVFSSPLVRAQQTADFLATEYHIKVEQMKELAPGHSPAEVCERLKQAKKLEAAMVVGHEPNCSELVSFLLLGSAAGLNIEFKKGSICIIESRDLSPGSGDLIVHLSPAVLRALR